MVKRTLSVSCPILFCLLLLLSCGSSQHIQHNSHTLTQQTNTIQSAVAWVGYDPKNGEMPHQLHTQWSLYRDRVNPITQVSGEIATIHANIAGYGTGYWIFNDTNLPTEQGFVISTRMKTIGTHPTSISVANGGEQFFFLIGNNQVELWVEDGGPPSQLIQVPGIPTNDDFHIYRITRKGQKVALYIDQSPTPTISTIIDDNNIAGSHDFIGFARADERGSGQAELDYILWKPLDPFQPSSLAIGHTITIQPNGGTFSPGHLQGITMDPYGNIYWSFNRDIVKTDTNGNVLRWIKVNNHHGDLTYYNGSIYVAVNYGAFNGGADRLAQEGEDLADNYIYEYRASDLRELHRTRAPELGYGAGGIAVREDEQNNPRFLVVGGLPKNVTNNLVYEYDKDLNFIQENTLELGAKSYTLLGIQTATHGGGKWWLGTYGAEDSYLNFHRKILEVDEESLNLTATRSYNPTPYNFGEGLFYLSDTTFLRGFTLYETPEEERTVGAQIDVVDINQNRCYGDSCQN